MAIDPAAAVGAVTRSVGTTERDGKTARTLTAERVYDTTPDDLWDALTNPERLPRWFLPVSGELKLGGRYQIIGNAGGTVTACRPPQHLGLTWEMMGQVSWVDVRIEPAGDGAKLILEHVAHVDDALWDQFGPGAVGVGWDLALHGLGLHLESGEALDPEAGAAWPTTPEGKVFVRGASEGWRDASIAAGTPAESAGPAAERSTGFYTGEAPPG